jgi:hypothetical protein
MAPLLQGSLHIDLHDCEYEESWTAIVDEHMFTFVASLMNLVWIDCGKMLNVVESDIQEILTESCGNWQYAAGLQWYRSGNCDIKKETALHLQALGVASIFLNSAIYLSLFSQQFAALKVLGTIELEDLSSEAETNQLKRILENCAALETLAIFIEEAPDARGLNALATILRETNISKLVLGWRCSHGHSKEDWDMFAEDFSFLDCLCLELEVCCTIIDGETLLNTDKLLKWTLLRLKCMMPSCHVLILTGEQEKGRAIQMIKTGTAMSRLWVTEETMRPVATFDSMVVTSVDCCSNCHAQGAKYRCATCRRTRYCSKKCQKAHWKASHKERCFPCVRRTHIPGVGQIEMR